MKQDRKNSKRKTAGTQIGLRIAVGAVVLLLAYAAWRELSPDNPWRQLAARYRTTGEGSEFRQQRTIELRTGRGFAISRYTATVDWSEPSVYLGQTMFFLGRRIELDFIYPSVRIPANAIRTCTLKAISADLGVELWIGDAGVRIGFPGYGRSYDQTIIDWCHARGIPVVTPTG